MPFGPTPAEGNPAGVAVPPRPGAQRRPSQPGKTPNQGAGGGAQSALPQVGDEPGSAAPTGGVASQLSDGYHTLVPLTVLSLRHPALLQALLAHNAQVVTMQQPTAVSGTSLHSCTLGSVFVLVPVHMWEEALRGQGGATVAVGAVSEGAADEGAPASCTGAVHGSTQEDGGDPPPELVAATKRLLEGKASIHHVVALPVGEGVTVESASSEQVPGVTCIDTGADVSLISETLFNQLGGELRPSTARIKQSGGSLQKVLGVAAHPLRIVLKRGTADETVRIPDKLYVMRDVEHIFDLLLGADVLNTVAAHADLKGEPTLVFHPRLHLIDWSTTARIPLVVTKGQQ